MSEDKKSSDTKLSGIELNIDSALIDDAKKAIEKYPKTPSEQIEQWAYLGRAVERELTKFEQLQLMSGEFEITVQKKGL